MNARPMAFRLRSVPLSLVIVALLFGGAGVTGVAAQSAIPGDTLYPVKAQIEQIRLGLAGDAGDRAEMKIAFAEMRLQEIAALIEEGRYSQVGETVLAFEASINGALLELEALAQADPARAARIAREITSALTRYAEILSAMAASAPESVRSDVTRALDSAQVAVGLEVPINDNANDNANDNGDDNGDDNANDTGDDNANDNGDDNANDNGDDNANDNGDDDGGNGNGDDDSGGGNDNDSGGSGNGNDDGYSDGNG